MEITFWGELMITILAILEFVRSIVFQCLQMHYRLGPMVIQPLQQLDLELAQKISQMRQLADRLAARLESNLKLELLKLPKDVQKMSMRDFCVQYGGDVDEAMKQTKMKDVLPPPVIPSVNLAAGKGASAEAAPASARGCV